MRLVPPPVVRRHATIWPNAKIKTTFSQNHRCTLFFGQHFQVTMAAMLPDEILRHIIAGLSFPDAFQASQVCRRWRACASAFAGAADLSELPLRLDASAAALSRGLLSIAARFPLLREIHFCTAGRTNAWFSTADIKAVVRRCSRLRQISACGQGIDMADALAECSAVKTVALFNQAPAPVPVDEIAAAAPPTLRALTIECTPSELSPPVALSATWTLTALTTLSLPGNALATINVGALVNMEVLDLSWNFISALPATIGNLRKLKVLRLSENRIETLPVELCGLPSIMCVDVSFNYLQSLPPEISGMRSLVFFNARYNMFFPAQVPRCVANHPAVVIGGVDFL